MNRTLRLIALTFALALTTGAAIQVYADDLPDTKSLHLRTGTVALNRAASLHKTAQGMQPLDSADHFVIQLEGPLTRERAVALEAAGIKLGQYLPMYAYMVNLPKGFRISSALGNLDFVRHIGRYDRAWKLDPQIGQMAVHGQDRIDLANSGKVKLTVKLFESEDLFTTAGQILNLGGVELSDLQQRANGGLLEVIMPRASVGRLADLSAVEFVEEAGEVTLRNNNNRWILQSNVSGSTPIWDHGITGVGQIGGHIDDALTPTHCAFSDPGGNPIGPTHRKILAYFGTQQYVSHGTFTGGMFVGDPVPVNGDPTYRGMAYGAKVVCTRLNTVTSANLLSKFQQDHDAGARVHTNSWGNDANNLYIQWSLDTDAFSYTNEDSLVLFAVTNNNSAITTPENAKNCIGIAGSANTPSQDFYCIGGHAFTQDGRRKPELMTPACTKISAQVSSTSCDFTGAGTGTSYACPSAAGAGLLVRQYYTDGFYPTGAAVPANGFTPSGALIKSTLINSGVNMTGIAGYPSDREGWGRILLHNALSFTGDTNKLIAYDIRNASGMSTSQSKTYSIDVNSSTVPLKIVLVWTEPAAALNANPAYINNLDLVVTAPGNNVYLGNFFDTNAGQSITGGTADFKNNTEVVLLSTPAVGTYTVNVNATAVNSGLQGFAITMTGDVTVHSNGPVPVSIVPNNANSGGTVAITALNGSNFQTVGTTNVKLRAPGFPDILATGVVVPNSNLITCNFDLTTAEPGARDVVVINPDSQTGSMRGAFTVNLVCIPGDVNRDGVVDAADIARFITMYTNGDAIPVERCAGDLDATHDGVINDADVSPFVNCVLNGGCP